MIRFRNIEDETRYNILRAEIIARLAPALPPALLNDFLRNYGKLETLVHVEGLRQGVASAALGEMMDQSPTTRDAEVHPKSLKAFQLHAAVYGSADSPLRNAEKAHLVRMGAPDDFLATSWLDDRPMHFEPLTLQELGGTQREVPVHRVAVAEPLPERLPVVRKPTGSEIDAELAALLGDEEPPSTEPMLIERVRDVLLLAMGEGWKPVDYNDLLMKVHTTIGANPFSVDLQLSTPMGRSMLMAIGVTISPPDEADANAMFTFMPALPPELAVSDATLADSDQKSDGPKSE